MKDTDTPAAVAGVGAETRWPATAGVRSTADTAIAGFEDVLANIQLRDVANYDRK